MSASVEHLGLFPDALYAKIEEQLGSKRTDTSLSRHKRDLDMDSFPTLAPALTPQTQLWITVVYVALYGLLFLIVYCQLWMIWYYRHKRLSYQTVFLFLCLVWTGLRTTLFSFYFNDCMLANNLPLPLDWLLYCFPVCLQFMTLCLLLLFFATVVFKARAKYEPSKYKRPLRIAVIVAILIFLTTNISCAIIVDEQEKNYNSVPIKFLIIRVSINDTLFLIVAIVLSICIYKMSRMSSANVVLEAKGTTLCKSILTCILLILLFTSRAIYNFIALCPLMINKVPSFGYNWVNVSDQADIYNLDNGYAFVSFGIVLFVWEFLPTFIIVIFFRVRKPASNMALTDLSSCSQNSRTYFFDNPRRYDSDDDLTRNDIPRGSNHDILTYSYSSVNSLNSARSTPRGTPRGYSAFHSGSYTGKVTGSPAAAGVQYGSSYHSYQNYNIDNR